MLFCRANGGEVRRVQQCFNTFAQWSGQVINPHKSYLLFSKNLDSARHEQLAAILRVQQSSDPGNYLRLPLSIPCSKTHACKQVQEKLNNPLAG